MSGPRTPISGLRRWLRQTPQPVKLRCDGKTIMRIASHSSRWSEAEKSVAALNCNVVEALDGRDEVLRVLQIQEPEEPEREPSQKETWPDSPDAQMAQIICASNDRAASRHENAYKMAFDKLTEMFNAQTMRLEEALQRAAYLEATLQKERESRSVPLPPTDGDGMQELNGFLAQAAANFLAQQAHGPTNGSSNGKSKGATQ